MVSTTYKGSKLEIGYASSGRSTILWYGQLIILRGLANCFEFHLEVKSGRPVNPLSPSRAGIIQDAAYNELIAFIKAEIFNFVFDPSNRRKIKAAHVEGCYKLDTAYSIATSPTSSLNQSKPSTARTPSNNSKEPMSSTFRRSSTSSHTMKPHFF
jgi:hypothetical protein